MVTKESKAEDTGQGLHIEGFILSSPERNLLRLRHTNLEKLLESGSIISQDPEFLAHSLIVMVYADDETREKRFSTRSGDIVSTKVGETKMRMGDRGISMYPNAHILVRNSADVPSQLSSSAALVMQALKESRVHV